ncbi:hypothetical protein J3R74_004301 [Puniceicoccus vermicola]
MLGLKLLFRWMSMGSFLGRGVLIFFVQSRRLEYEYREIYPAPQF